MIKPFVAAAAALALASAPALAAEAPPAAALSLAPETIEGDNGQAFERTGILIPLAVVVALGLGVYFLFLDNEDEPVSA